jgi:hypothetical protein
MYSKEQLIEFANYCILNIASDKLQETIFNEWDSKKDYDKVRKHFIIYLSKLKSPYAEQAIANFSQEFAKDVNINLINDVESALNRAFDWYKSPQGTSYWNNIYNNIDKYLK